MPDEWNEEEQDDQYKLIDSLSDEFQEQVNLIRCAVYTLQLARLDVVDKTEESVQMITTIAKKCRGVKYKKHFECHKTTYPPVWAQTSWEAFSKW